MGFFEIRPTGVELYNRLLEIVIFHCRASKNHANSVNRPRWIRFRPLFDLAVTGGSPGVFFSTRPQIWNRTRKRNEISTWDFFCWVEVRLINPEKNWQRHLATTSFSENFTDLGQSLQNYRVPIELPIFLLTKSCFLFPTKKRRATAHFVYELQFFLRSCRKNTPSPPLGLPPMAARSNGRWNRIHGSDLST